MRTLWWYATEDGKEFSDLTCWFLDAEHTIQAQAGPQNGDEAYVIGAFGWVGFPEWTLALFDTTGFSGQWAQSGVDNLPFTATQGITIAEGGVLRLGHAGGTLQSWGGNGSAADNAVVVNVQLIGSVGDDADITDGCGDAVNDDETSGYPTAAVIGDNAVLRGSFALNAKQNTDGSWIAASIGSDSTWYDTTSRAEESIIGSHSSWHGLHPLESICDAPLVDPTSTGQITAAGAVLSFSGSYAAALAAVASDVATISTNLGTPAEEHTIAGDVASLLGFTPSAISSAFLDHPNAVDGKTPRQTLQIMAAILAGTTTGAGTNAETFTGINGSTIRVRVTTDAEANRLAVEFDPGE